MKLKLSWLAVGLFVVLLLFACSNENTSTVASSNVNGIKMNYVGYLGSKSGSGNHGSQFQDDNGCYWIKSEGVFTQVFEIYEYTINGSTKVKESIPRCD